MRQPERRTNKSLKRPNCGETTDRLVTDALGFRLEVVISIGDFPNLGQHRVDADAETGKVIAQATHHLNIKAGLDASSLTLVVAHEIYHLFYSVRHLITVDEEIEAEAFGELIKRVLAISRHPKIEPDVVAVLEELIGRFDRLGQSPRGDYADKKAFFSAAYKLLSFAHSMADDPKRAIALIKNHKPGK